MFFVVVFAIISSAFFGLSGGIFFYPYPNEVSANEGIVASVIIAIIAGIIALVAFYIFRELLRKRYLDCIPYADKPSYSGQPSLYVLPLEVGETYTMLANDGRRLAFIQGSDGRVLCRNFCFERHISQISPGQRFAVVKSQYEGGGLEYLSLDSSTDGTTDTVADADL
jgi:hypothetical protein